MGELNFRTGRKTYTVNGDAEISFDPTDISFVNRLFGLVDKMEKSQQEPAPEDPMEVFAAAARRDAEMRAEIDAVFGEPVCDKIFGSTNVYSLAGGLPVCMNFMLAIIDEIDAASEEERKQSPALDSYIRKYETKYGKYMKK